MGEYWSALWGHWVTLMSGIVALIIGLGLRVTRRITELNWSDIPDWLFIGIGIICLLWAGYKTWDDEHTALIALQERLKAPEFGGYIGTVSTGGRYGYKGLMIVAGGVITNPLGPPSAALNWEMKIELAGGRVVTGESVPPSGKDIALSLGDAGDTIILTPSNHWPTKTTQPIPAGGASEGWLMSVFFDIDQQQLYEPGTMIVVIFKDAVSGKQHSLRHPMPAHGTHVPGFKK